MGEIKLSNFHGMENPADIDSIPYQKVGSYEEIRGVLDRAQGNRISGWVMYPRMPSKSVKLLIKIKKEGEFIVIADHFRPDILAKNIHPTGKCGFLLVLPDDIILHSGDIINLRVIGDSEELKAISIPGKANSHSICIPNIVIVYGSPRSGKSSFSREFANYDGVLWIMTDLLFLSYIFPSLDNQQHFIVNQGQPGEHFSIAKYVDSKFYDEELFVNLLAEDLKHRLKRSPESHTVILDGYIFKRHAELISKLKLAISRVLVLHASFIENRYMIGQFDVTNHKYTELFHYIYETFKANCLDKTLPNSTYQNFISLCLPDTGEKKSDSNTSEKYTMSHLDDVLQISDRFADLGCNAGYFCFRARNKTMGSIVGIDAETKWLEIASHINNSIFLYTNLIFIKSDALVFLSGVRNTFEVIHCSSTYHYFREKQIVFLSYVHRALVESGILVLEVELANTGSEPQIIKRSRGVDSTPCFFPNRSMFLQQIENLFQIENEFQSIFQEGSFYERTYFHLRPVSNKTRYMEHEMILRINS